jgi:hypothetical protein
MNKKHHLSWSILVHVLGWLFLLQLLLGLVELMLAAGVVKRGQLEAAIMTIYHNKQEHDLTCRSSLLTPVGGRSYCRCCWGWWS